ncbi:cytochrome c oxidase assembly protein [Gellertiella hungarica]|uniref:Cytochrome c oxidase assembly protein CtaG n=1 Tax=Gellertiella hungarica TaxID=1572859 RepID=A0A7W6J449_9HYPH|nr:cytochrome c oxidase assembly protein [Gellertiella hungarica]MBB4064440.1 cytochrome c oxidase assembly protein subunit 11 [Gellertiella hungarica]
MAEIPAPAQGPKGRNNGMTVAVCLAFVAGMVGMSYAAVPLYRMFCEFTGYNGTTQRVEQVSDVVLDRDITVSFDPNVAAGLPWEFKAVQREVTMKIGETVQVDFTIHNDTDKPTVGQARFNVTPMQAAAYFNKVQCFCFERTELKPGESREMPVVFYIDPEIVKHVETDSIGTITLSYTFYPQDDKPVAQNAVKAEGQKQL